MNFFEHQEAARRNTARLISLYLAAVAGIILAVYFVVLALFFAGESRNADRVTYGAESVFEVWNPDVFWPVLTVVLGIIIVGTTVRILSLARGGKAVAEMLGGRPIAPDTTDPDERRLLHVVEEMALAAGTVVPPVYLLEEKGINAFAAGFSPKDAVIGVTRGCVRLLSRDELQGVIAHEFSHILNGDMNLNLKLMGILNGILVLAFLGQILMRSTFYSRIGYRSRSRNGGGTAALFFLGGALILIGYVGVFFGNLIKSAVSRQREFLADASAVQYTRNPDGIAGALKKIGGLSQAGRLENPRAAEASHLFFANGLSGGPGSLWATHPPLEERIRRIDPSFFGEFPVIRFPAEERKPDPGSGRQRSAVMPAAATAFRASREGFIPAFSGSLTERVGSPAPEHFEEARRILEHIPEIVARNARDPFGARAVIYFLLLDKKSPEVREMQLKRLFVSSDNRVYQALLALNREMSGLEAGVRFPLAGLCLPALTRLSMGQYRQFSANMKALILADGRLEPFELALLLVVSRRLREEFRGEPGGRTDAGRGKATKEEAFRLLLSLLARAGQEEAGAADAFGEALRRAGMVSDAGFAAPEALTLERIETAAELLADSAPETRKKFLDGAMAAVTHDGRITMAEAELVRAFAAVMDCPIPPLLST